MNNEHRVEVQVEEQVGPLDTTAVEQAALLTLLRHRLGEPCELVVVISDDEALRDLNQRFRGRPGPTDVLSFADDTKGPFSGGAVGFPRYLGDIVISLDRARVQAEEAGGSLEDELRVLTVHGVLHLLGYDHEETGDKERMWAQQTEILQLLHVDLPLPE